MDAQVPSDIHMADKSRDAITLVVLIAAAVFVIHITTNHRYGFHRDELQLIDDSRHLDWGYVVYPPLTPAIARMALETFGTSPWGIRVPAALAQSLVIVLAGLMVRDLGGGRAAQLLAAAMTAIAPVAVIQGALLQYVGFDLLWWVVIAWLMIRLIGTDDPRWWVAIGAAIGLGMLTRYTIGFFVAALVAAVLLTPLRRHLASRWLWLGVAVSLLIAMPNLIWQYRHDFVSLEFLQSIHARDVRIGRTSGFFIEQLFVPASTFTIPWWIAGLWFYFSSTGKPYRALGWMFVATLIFFAVMQGRGYYMAPAYPMLLAAGAVVWERLLARGRRTAMALASIAVIFGAAFSGAVMLPLAPVNSSLWHFTTKIHDNFVEEIGWPELAASVARVYLQVPSDERRRTAIFASNYGQAGAINLYGPKHGLPRAISGVNSHWYRGYGDPPPETLVILGATEQRAEKYFRSCDVGAIVSNPYGVENEESGGAVLVCRGLRVPWPELWKQARSFG
jgi:4-amino-4-deoxy-L-arabinose transferase-like glycosyltransferase